METFLFIFGDADPGITWWQMCARAVVITLYALVLLRISARRALGNNTALDMLVAVIVGSALSRALTGTADLLPTLAATAFLFVLHWVISALAVRLSWFSVLTKGRSIRLAEDGRMDWRRARRALIGEHDMREELRLHGLRDMAEVDSAHLERNGRISIVRRP